MGVGDTPHFICSYRCYNGELFAQGTKQEMSIVFYGTVFEALPSQVHFCVLFYNCQPPQRSIRLLSASHKTDCIDLLQRESVSVEGQIDRTKEVGSFIRSLVK